VNDRDEQPTATFDLGRHTDLTVPLWIDALGVVAWAAAVVAICVTPAVVIAAWQALL